MLKVLEHSLFAVIKLCWGARRKYTEDGRLLNRYKYSLSHSLTSCLLGGGVGLGAVEAEEKVLA